MPKPPVTPLSVLDLSPVSAGQTPGDALRSTLALAAAAEASGYSRYWLAEHHLNTGVAGSAPHILAGLVASATKTIRVGTAATLLGNYRPLQIAESIGTLAAVFPDRVDLGFGRSGPPKSPSDPAPGVVPADSSEPTDRVVDGLLIPAPRPIFGAVLPRKFRLQGELLGRFPGDTDNFENDIQDIIGFFTGEYRTKHGEEVTATPALGQAPQFWVHGSTAGPSARLAGKLGLPFGANYHVAPAGVLDSIAEYRAHFEPSAALPEPHVIVSADVLVAPDERQAQRLARGYAQWVYGIRSGQGAIPYPSPEDALELFLDAEAGELIKDRLDTRFVGDPHQVSEGLRTLQRATGAQELLITTIAHDPADRQNSYQLLAEVWGL
ncbi:LLM class flavin-dependent oxidoreductase [Paenarthrobacter ilicis]|uniref:Alkanesulfonate monooxygenase SsuD/methylene tetrahydromethanopterin reductase-like flavin-dependent oxidoreductase (Luciferase family) n=1 Tax=Paenarthrobacter ilicis TaxID=43665 RepID=A0ABX0TMP4_9MICC|nr:LLM class flavin-dependent oxidoreductase [Paenarthrobacter ilicis]MBM7793078.1 alkanesulfonate monooxygenase SsuD/methylene tetrahydromethanopterin reductase-like flavin-dependent oxidoreductase (luciferase family) [Paenarthrobacter ilicis]NIJ02146.1 alkanesulfonate monooxygenase SsuD/methylene tetrahydromethanopterin reductase-like flavin-dependent oxidoreductase (luciferase family) [Paenarthrobacter ilicis]